jgi:hypothetical protein
MRRAYLRHLVEALRRSGLLLVGPSRLLVRVQREREALEARLELDRRGELGLLEPRIVVHGRVKGQNVLHGELDRIGPVRRVALAALLFARSPQLMLLRHRRAQLLLLLLCRLLHLLGALDGALRLAQVGVLFTQFSARVLSCDLRVEDVDCVSRRHRAVSLPERLLEPLCADAVHTARTGSRGRARRPQRRLASKPLCANAAQAAAASSCPPRKITRFFLCFFKAPFVFCVFFKAPYTPSKQHSAL